MRTRRFFAAPDEIQGNVARLSPEESHHLRDVLRLPAGVEVELFDGSGRLFRARVRRTDRLVELDILEQLATESESSLHIVVAQSLIKGDRFSWLVQKCTELGLSELYPLVSRFSDAGPRRQAEVQWNQRWKRIALSAAAQSRRATGPVVHPASEVGVFCRRFSGQAGSAILPGLEATDADSLKLVLSERGGLPARSLSGFVTPRLVILAIGPEGGWAGEELAGFKDSGFLEVHMGSRILRSETAAVAAVALVQYLWGDLGS